jgi:hypothetical protein
MTFFVALQPRSFPGVALSPSKRPVRQTAPASPLKRKKLQVFQIRKPFEPDELYALLDNMKPS